MRFDHVLESIETVRCVLVERSGLRTFRHIFGHVADLPTSMALPGRMQRVLSALHGLEHLVSTVPGPPLVYTMRRRADHALAVVLLLSMGRMVRRFPSGQARFRRAACHLHHRRPTAQPDRTYFQKIAMS